MLITSGNKQVCGNGKDNRILLIYKWVQN